MPTRFDWQTAMEGLRLLELAHHRYDQAELGLVAARLHGEELHDALLWIYGLAVDTMTRARGLDDWCRGREGDGIELTHYMDSLVLWDHASEPGHPIATDQPSQSADLLAGARFVANKSIHVFATLARNSPVWIAPGGLDPKQFGLPVWLRADALPPDSVLGRPDPARRAAYGRMLAGNKIGWSLDALLSHFRWWLVEVPRHSRSS